MGGDIKRFGTSKQQEVRDREEQQWLSGEIDYEEGFRKGGVVKKKAHGGVVHGKELTKTQKNLLAKEVERKKAARKKRRRRIMSQIGLTPVGKSTRTKTLKYTARGGLIKPVHKDYRKGGLFKKDK
jgi:hypothetical protein